MKDCLMVKGRKKEKGKYNSPSLKFQQHLENIRKYKIWKYFIMLQTMGNRWIWNW